MEITNFTTVLLVITSEHVATTLRPGEARSFEFNSGAIEHCA